MNFSLSNVIIIIAIMFILFDTDVEDKSSDHDQRREAHLLREVSDKLVCSACKCPFNNREEQVSTRETQHSLTH